LLGIAAELVWIDRDWYRMGPLDFVTSATYMLLALITMTSLEELLLLVRVGQINYSVVINDTS